jgi:hypothetical protein
MTGLGPADVLATVPMNANVSVYWNKYWWFERNGMPFGGLPDSSSHSGYANAMIWVQGPEENFCCTY